MSSDQPKPPEGLVDRVDELERVIIDLRELLEAAEFWLEHTPQEERTIGMLKVLGRIRAELAGSSEPKPEVPPVSALRWVADTVERGDSELDCSLEEVNAVIRWLRAWAERVEETSDD